MQAPGLGRAFLVPEPRVPGEFLITMRAQRQERPDMRNPFPLIAAALALAVAALGGCPKNVPGAGSVPSVPGGMSGEVDPNTCGNYALMDGGAKLKAFLQATKDLEITTEETVKVVKQSCEMIGREMGMSDADFQGDTKAVCAKVYQTLRDNMKVAFKVQAGLKIHYKPAVCRVNIDAEAKAAAECEGHASADVGASCTGACHGRCDGTCSGKAGTGGNSAQCDGECKGTCHGECEGHAKVNASAQCRASASVKANAEVKCTEPELTIQANAQEKHVSREIREQRHRNPVHLPLVCDRMCRSPFRVRESRSRMLWLGADDGWHHGAEHSEHTQNAQQHHQTAPGGS